MQRRGYFHASDDNREVRRFLCEGLIGSLFNFTMLMVDKTAASKHHAVKSTASLHQLLLREAINASSAAHHCRSLELRVGMHPETLKSERVVNRVLRYHEDRQILEAISFPIGNTVRTKFSEVKVVTPAQEPLMDAVDYLIWAHQREEFKDDEIWHVFLRAGGLRASFKETERFPGIIRIFTCSNWYPRDPVLETMPFRTFSPSVTKSVLDRMMSGLGLCLKRGQQNPLLHQTYRLGVKIMNGDRSSETSFGFGRGLFEVIDTEAVPLFLSELEFNVVKRGAAVCCLVGEKRMRKPPIQDWEKMLGEFFSLITGQEARIGFS